MPVIAFTGRSLVVLAGLLVAMAGCNGDDDPRVAVTSPAILSPTTTVPSTVAATAAPTTVAPTTATSSRPETTQPVTTVAAQSCPSLTAGVHDVTLFGGGAEHPVRIFVPTAFAQQPLPVVIDWHGLGSNGTEQAMFSGYEAVAEAEGFLVVHPTGVSDDPGGPNSWQLFPATDGRDDLAFAAALIDHLIADWCADAARVYSTGMSNGGFFTARLICELGERIAAAVSVAGLFHPDTCSPARPVPYMAVHGTDDQVVPFDGSGRSVLLSPESPESNRVFFEQVIPEEFAEFAADAQCAPGATTEPVGSDVIQHAYTACAGATPLDFFEVVGGGHTWPGSPMADLVRDSLGYTTETIDATVDGWAFMSQYDLP